MGLLFTSRLRHPPAVAALCDHVTRLGGSVGYAAAAYGPPAQFFVRFRATRDVARRVAAAFVAYCVVSIDTTYPDRGGDDVYFLQLNPAAVAYVAAGARHDRQRRRLRTVLGYVLDYVDAHPATAKILPVDCRQ